MIIMESYLASLRGIRIFPGSWRPHYPFEQIAWISPSWPSHDYLWLDFPEAIFTDIGLICLSHVNPKYPMLLPNLPKVHWKHPSKWLSIQKDTSKRHRVWRQTLYREINNG